MLRDNSTSEDLTINFYDCFREGTLHSERVHATSTVWICCKLAVNDSGLPFQGLVAVHKVIQLFTGWEYLWKKRRTILRPNQVVIGLVVYIKLLYYILCGISYDFYTIMIKPARLSTNLASCVSSF